MNTAQHSLNSMRPAAALPPLGIAPASNRRPPGCKSQRVSEREQAHLRCLRALAGTPVTVRSLLVEIDRDDANLILAAGDQPIVIWRLTVLPKELMGLDSLRARIRATLDQMRIISVCGSVERIVVTSKGTALARSVLVDALLERIGAVTVRRAEDAAAA